MTRAAHGGQEARWPFPRRETSRRVNHLTYFISQTGCNAFQCILSSQLNGVTTRDDGLCKSYSRNNRANLIGSKALVTPKGGGGRPLVAVEVSAFGRAKAEEVCRVA